MRSSFLRSLPESLREKKGFSLIEVMVGFAVFALSMISVMGVVSMSQFIGQSARNRIEALQNGRFIMEYLKSETYHSDTMVVDGYTISVQFNSPNWEYVITNGSGTTVATLFRQSEGFPGTYRVTDRTGELDPGETGELKQIVLNINYDSFLGTDTLQLVAEKSRALH